MVKGSNVSLNHFTELLENNVLLFLFKVIVQRARQCQLVHRISNKETERIVWSTLIIGIYRKQGNKVILGEIFVLIHFLDRSTTFKNKGPLSTQAVSTNDIPAYVRTQQYTNAASSSSDHSPKSAATKPQKYKPSFIPPPSSFNKTYSGSR